jgi:hypothetical protein
MVVRRDFDGLSCDLNGLFEVVYCSCAFILALELVSKVV